MVIKDIVFVSNTLLNPTAWLCGWTRGRNTAAESLQLRRKTIFLSWREQKVTAVLPAWRGGSRQTTSFCPATIWSSYILLFSTLRTSFTPSALCCQSVQSWHSDQVLVSRVEESRKSLWQTPPSSLCCSPASSFSNWLSREPAHSLRCSPPCTWATAAGTQTMREQSQS